MPLWGVASPSGLRGLGHELDGFLGGFRPRLEHGDDVEAVLALDEDLLGLHVARDLGNLCKARTQREQSVFIGGFTYGASC